MNMIKFSIIVPAYNAAKWIEECISSILNQTYNNYEIIIIDDGSNDCTFKLITDLQARNIKKIQIFHQNNSGQIASRLKGIALADSDYCLFVDADDTLEVNALEALNSTIEKNNSDMVIFNGNKWDGGNKKILFWPEYKEKIWISDIDGINKIREKVIQGKRFNNICFKAIRTAILKSTKNYQNVEFIRKEEDLLMQLPYFDKIQSVTYLPYELYNYRDNIQSITYSYNHGQFQGCCFVSHELRKYAKKWHVKNYEAYCNTRFLQEVIVCIKQIGKAYKEKSQRIGYFNEIEKNNYFRSVLKSKNYSLTVKQKIILNALAHENYLLVNTVI